MTVNSLDTPFTSTIQASVVKKTSGGNFFRFLGTLMISLSVHCKTTDFKYTFSSVVGGRNVTYIKRDASVYLQCQIDKPESFLFNF